MWIVRVALNRPYTFVVLALLLVLLGPLAVLRTPTDIFPNIDIPVISVLWNYAGLSPQEMAERLVTGHERALTTTVDNIEHTESQSLNGVSVEKVFFQPHANINLALAQVTAISQSMLRQDPVGTTPPFIITYTASSVPVLQLALSGPGMTEQQIFDLGVNFVRTRLVTVPGVGIPYPYGGKQREVMVDLNPALLQSKGLSPLDVVNALGNQNLILPAGTVKIGAFEYQVSLNGSPQTVQELNDLPIETVAGSTVYVRDVAQVRDGFPPQTNIVRVNGQRASLLTVLKVGAASTLDVIAGVKKALPALLATLPPNFRITPMADQSVFVRAAIGSVAREAIIAACLTALMILLFLGSWRSTLIIAVSIPLSVLASLLMLSVLGETINIMTLGGLALAVGILVDDATVAIENIERTLAEGWPHEEAILRGSAQIAVPALVSTLSICIVFVPMFFLTGVARYLFVPMAEAVVFAMLASYLLSRTLVVTMAKYLLRRGEHPAGTSWAARFQGGFAAGFERLRAWHGRGLDGCMRHRGWFLAGFLACCLASFALVPWLGADFFPAVDSGQFKLHLRAPTGTRIEETAALCDRVEANIRQQIPPSQLVSIIDNIGLPYSTLNLSYTNSAPTGTADADIMVQLSQRHTPTSTYMKRLRETLPQAFPGTSFYFLPADMISQILDFGLPAPIDVQVVGANLDANRAFADRLLFRLQHVPGTVDMRIQQAFNQPELRVNVDRTKASQLGLTQHDVASDLLISLSGSGQTSPAFWLDPANGVSYSVVTETPQYRSDSLQDLENLPLNPAAAPSQILANVGTVTPADTASVVSHYDVAPVIDIYGDVQGRDLGGVASDFSRILDQARSQLPRGSQLIERGEIQTMTSSYTGLLGGLLFSILLVYALIVVNFQSWLDPLIIISALPAALAGIVWILFATGTRLSVPALTGSIMCMGVATANSILVVAFAKEKLLEGRSPREAALAAGTTRFRPVLMTALAMIIGMLPMSFALGEGGEQNAPLGRAVVGGLTFATVSTLFFVPVLFSWLHDRRHHPAGERS